MDKKVLFAAAGVGVAFYLIGAASGSVGAGFVIMILALLYALPTLTAYSRKVNNAGQIALLNILAGWTFIGWIVAMVWAAKPVTEPGRHAVAEKPNGLDTWNF
jgi:hypothetical protein